MKKGIEPFIVENLDGNVGRLGYFLSYVPLLLVQLIVPLLLNPVDFYGEGMGISGIVIIVMAIIITIVSTLIFGPFLLVKLLGQIFMGGIDIIVTVVTIVFIIPVLVIGVKRCHDLGHSGWRQFIPLYSVWMLFAPGKK